MVVGEVFGGIRDAAVEGVLIDCIGCGVFMLRCC